LLLRLRLRLQALAQPDEVGEASGKVSGDLVVSFLRSAS